MSFPLIVRAIRLSIESLDRELESAARTLGARPLAGVLDCHPAIDRARDC